MDMEAQPLDRGLNSGASVTLTSVEAERLGLAIQTRSIQLGLSRRGLALQADISRAHIVRLMNGEQLNLHRVTVAKLERALQWPPGHAELVALGTDDVDITTRAPIEAEQQLTQSQLDAEWTVVVREAAQHDRLTQQAALEAAKRILYGEL